MIPELLPPVTPPVVRPVRLLVTKVFAFGATVLVVMTMDVAVVAALPVAPEQMPQQASMRQQRSPRDSSA